MSIADDLRGIITVKEGIRRAAGIDLGVPFAHYAPILRGDPSPEDEDVHGAYAQSVKLAATKEDLRITLQLEETEPFARYPLHAGWYGEEIPDGSSFDFVKNRYSKDGVPSRLSDISEFIRLSSATEWGDGKLDEVANNIPRISGEGLLIEPQRTNNFVGDLLDYGIGSNTSITYFGTSMSSPYYELQAIEDGDVTSAHVGSLGTIDQDYTVSAATLKVGDSVAVSTLRAGGGNYATATLTTATDAVTISSAGTPLSDGGYIPIVDTRGVLWASRGPVELNSGSTHYRIRANGLSEGEVLDVYAPQAEIGFGVTSYIPTYDAPATRAPDILNIPLLPTQTLSGDWDAGVTYTVADGIATFTGHGYIRNITVEET